jgi:hypothetical protein
MISTALPVGSRNKTKLVKNITIMVTLMRISSRSLDKLLQLRVKVHEMVVQILDRGSVGR